MQKKSDKEKKAKVKTTEVEVKDYTKPLNEYVDYLSVSTGPPIIDSLILTQVKTRQQKLSSACDSTDPVQAID